MDKEGCQFENREQPTITTEIITGDELMEIIYQGKHLPQDERFLPFKEGGRFKYLMLEKLINRQSHSRELYYAIVRVDGKIVGISELEKSPNEEDVFWRTFTSVDPDYRGQGHGTRLLEETFRFAKERNSAIKGSSYSDEGRLKLKPLNKKLAGQYGVKFIDPDEKDKNDNGY